MESSQETTFNETLRQQARLFKALAHPARLAILQYLAEIKTCMTGDIADELPLSRTTVNQHLKELRDAGLIKGTVAGVRTNYCLSAQGIQQLQREAGNFFSRIDVKQTWC